jgi:hypothetical protein
MGPDERLSHVPDEYSSQEREGLRVRRDVSRGDTGGRLGEGRGAAFQLPGMQKYAVRQGATLSPMDHLYRALSVFHALARLPVPAVDRLEADPLYAQGMQDLKSGIEALRQEAIG